MAARLHAFVCKFTLSTIACCCDAALAACAVAAVAVFLAVALTIRWMCMRRHSTAVQGASEAVVRHPMAPEGPGNGAEPPKEGTGEPAWPMRPTGELLPALKSHESCPTGAQACGGA
jgi:hypothetical protein